jgi:hypothetical protein
MGRSAIQIRVDKTFTFIDDLTLLVLNDLHTDTPLWRILIADVKAIKASANSNPHGLPFSLPEFMDVVRRVHDDQGICEIAIRKVHDLFIAQVNVLDFLTERDGERTSVMQCADTYVPENMLGSSFFFWVF